MGLKKDDIRSVRVAKLARNLTGRPVAYRTWSTRIKSGERERIAHIYAGRVENVNEEGIARVKVLAVLSDDGKTWVKLSKETVLRARADMLVPLSEKKRTR